MNKVYNFLKTPHPQLRLALWSAAAAATAYGIGLAIPSINATVAGITALIAIRPTFHDTAAEMLRQILGTIIGAAFGLLLTHLFGVNPIGILVLVLVSFLMAKVMKLGNEGAITMGVTVILVFGPGFGAQAVQSRFLGIVFGALIALLVSLWVRPGTPHSRALSASVTHANAAAELLTNIAVHLASGKGKVDKVIAKSWVTEADSILKELNITHDEATSALRSAKWSPLVNKKEAVAIVGQIEIAQSTARTAHAIAEDLLSSSKTKKPIPENMALNLSEIIAATANTIQGQAKIAKTKPAKSLKQTDTSVLGWATLRDETAVKVKELNETQPLIIAGSILRKVGHINDVLTQSPETSTNTLPLPIAK